MMVQPSNPKNEKTIPMILEMGDKYMGRYSLNVFIIINLMKINLIKVGN